MVRKVIDDWSVDPIRKSASDRLPIARLEWCLGALRELGCETNPSSRLPSALRLLKQVHTAPALLEEEVVRIRLAEAYRAAWEFMIILSAAHDARQDTTIFTKEKLELAIKGAATSVEANTVGRDTQFELYVPALFAVAGFDISRGRTDARWDYLGEHLEIEAKRMSSETANRLRDSLENAAEQIMGPKAAGPIEIVRSRGIIAVNVDVHFTTVAARNNPADLVVEFSERLKILDEAGKGLLSRHGLIGVLAAGHVAHWTLASEPGAVTQLAISYPMRWASLVGDDPAEKSSVSRFYRVIDAIARKVDSLQFSVPRRHAS